MCIFKIETAEEPSVAIARIQSRILDIRAGYREHPFDLRRFVEAQGRGVYEQALSELRSGKKKGHWMWFVFPQHRDLGRSPTAKFYGLSGDEEAGAYLAHPLLGPRLRECVEAVRAHLNIGTSLEAIFGDLDAMKYRTSMATFRHLEGD